MSGSFLTFDLSTPLSLSNPIQGNQGHIDANTLNDGTTLIGGLAKTGNGKLSLSGENTYTGKTIVAEGELSINSSVVTDVEVLSNGTLSGSFNVKKNIQGTNNGDLKNEGILMPGSGNGVITLEGDFEQTLSGTLVIYITPPSNDKIVCQNATLDNNTKLKVHLGDGNYIHGTLFTIIEGITSFNQINLEKVGPFADFVEVDIVSGSLKLFVKEDVFFQGKKVYSFWGY